MEDSTVTGAICVDDSGFTISQQGMVDHESVAAATRDIIVLAKKLDRTSSETPTVILSSDNHNTIITQDDSVTIAVQKKKVSD